MTCTFKLENTQYGRTDIILLKFPLAFVVEYRPEQLGQLQGRSVLMW